MSMVVDHRTAGKKENLIFNAETLKKCPIDLSSPLFHIALVFSHQRVYYHSFFRRRSTENVGSDEGIRGCLLSPMMEEEEEF